MVYDEQMQRLCAQATQSAPTWPASVPAPAPAFMKRRRLARLPSFPNALPHVNCSTVQHSRRQETSMFLYIQQTYAPSTARLADARL